MDAKNDFAVPPKEVSQMDQHLGRMNDSRMRLGECASRLWAFAHRAGSHLPPSAGSEINTGTKQASDNYMARMEEQANWLESLSYELGTLATALETVL